MVNKTAFLYTSSVISAKSICYLRMEAENLINRSAVKDALYLCLEQFPLHICSPAVCPLITQGKKLNIQIVIIYLEDIKKIKPSQYLSFWKKALYMADALFRVN